MLKQANAGLVLCAVALLAGCGGSSGGSDGGGGGGGEVDPLVARAIAYGGPAAPSLPPGGPNAAPAAVEITELDDGSFRLDVIEGNSSGQSWSCSGSISDLDCTIEGGTPGEDGSFSQIVGSFSTALTLYLEDQNGGEDYFTNTLLFYPLDPTIETTLPSGSATYTGEVDGGANINNTSGDFDGEFTLSANFGTGTVNGSIEGFNPGGDVTATWTNAVIDPATASFNEGPDTTYTFQGGPADLSEVAGGFFGPNGQEVSGGLIIGFEDQAAMVVFNGTSN